MSQGKEILPTKLKFYHIILLSCLLCAVLILNSNYVNQRREKEKMSLKADKLFNEIISRRLSQETDRRSKTKDVCSRGSDDLKKYYQTGDLSLIDLDNQPIKCEDKDADYMKALRALAKNFLGDDDSSSNNLRNLDEGDSDMDNILQYGMRILPMVIFLGIGVLSIFGWIGCCIFNCCDCCCCCCCKKTKCKIPCFIFSYVFYALSIAISIYGLTQSNKIFEGLADTECSLLQFFDQILYGEPREQDGPHWAGINTINTMLISLKNQITTMSSGTNTELANKIGVINTQKTTFKQEIEGAGGKIFDSPSSTHYKEDISVHYTGKNIKLNGQIIYLNGYYVIDLVTKLGKYEGNKFTDGSILATWNSEYSTLSSEADGYISTANDSFTDILNTNLGPIQTALDDAKRSLEDIEDPFNDVNSDIGDTLADFSEKIDEYGKLAVKLVFSVLMVINIGLAAFMTLIGLFSMKACADCCFCRCLFKSAVHILWNILALMMILSFLVGSILGLIGQVGNDMMSLVSFIFSAENFNNQHNPLFVNRLGDEGKRYINRCINGDGNIGAELNIEDSISSINNISSIERSINSTYNSFYNLSQCFTYKGVQSQLNERESLKTNYLLIKEGNDATSSPISFDDLITSLNNEIGSGDPHEKWGRNVDNDLHCESGDGKAGSFDSNVDYNPKQCSPKNRNWIINKGTGHFVYELATVIDDAMELVKNTKSEDKIFMGTLKDLNGKYKVYLDSYLKVLEFLQGKIGDILDIIRPYIEEGDAFSFLNGKFIGTNIKILLKYLKDSLGTDIYTVGVCLVVVGFSLILSISSTILLNVIINIAMKEAMQQNPPVVSEFQMNRPDTVVTPQY